MGRPDHPSVEAALEELLPNVPKKKREEVGAFLRAQELENLGDLAAVTDSDLSEAFRAAPASFTVSHCALVRGLRSKANTAVQVRARGHRLSSQGLVVLKIGLLVALGFVNCALGTWHVVTGFDEVKCAHGAHGNSSGIEVLVAGFEGAGSETILDALHQLGLRSSYTSEDFSMFVWSSVASAFWMRPENGGKWPVMPMPSIAELWGGPLSEFWSPPSMRRWSDQDVKVLRHLQPKQLAHAIKSCNVEAVALESMERLTWPIYQVSQGVKVISLSSRSYEEYYMRPPRSSHAWQFVWAVITAGQHVLPWGLLYKAIDFTSGWKGVEWLALGGPPMRKVSDAHTAFLRTLEHAHRVRRHFYGGLGLQPTKEEYKQFHESIRRTVPASHLLEWDPHQHTWQDLCQFMGRKQCPKSGRVEPLLVGQVEYDAFQRIVFYALFWVVNWKVVSVLLRWFKRPFTALGRVLGKVLWRCSAVVEPRFLLKLYVAVSIGGLLEAYDVWGPLNNWDTRCERPELPANNSGVKVLVAGLAKSGTRTMSRTLWQLGMNGSFHSEELSMYMWNRVADDYWLRPENGGMWPRPSFSQTSDFYKSYFDSDKEVIANTNTTVLASELSKCGVEAVAFDCIENLFWPIYDASPGVKVLSLNWRSFREHALSAMQFHKDFNSMCTALGVLFGGQHVLPWAWLHKHFDPLVGSPVAKMLKEGRPAICQEYPPWMSLFHSLHGGRRIMSHWYSGLAWFVTTEQEYNYFYDLVRKKVPKRRYMEWDMRKHRWEDLCRFLEVDPCPRMGRLDRAINVFNFERDFPVLFWARVPYFLLIHNLNWRIFGLVLWLLSLLLQSFTSLLRRMSHKSV